MINKLLLKRIVRNNLSLIARENIFLLDFTINLIHLIMTGLCKLKYLEELDISYNMFSAQLPECLSNLTNLKVLELKNNLLSGNFPSFTTNLTSLVHLSLYGNNMNGSFLLSTLANHSNLQNLKIEYGFQNFN
jgi:Leucine-rich repeat (LRR) protein